LKVLLAVVLVPSTIFEFYRQPLPDDELYEIVKLQHLCAKLSFRFK